MKPFLISESKFKEIDRIIRNLPGNVDHFYRNYDPWNDDITDEQYRSFHHYDYNSDYWHDWKDCPIRKRQQTINDIIDAPNGYTIGENAILR